MTPFDATLSRPMDQPVAMATASADALLTRIHADLNAFANWLMLLGDLRRERRALASLDDRMLRDIGVDQATASHEGSRGWLDVPAHRARQIVAADS